MMFEIEAAEAWDIDEELDFAITDFLMQHRQVSQPTQATRVSKNPEK